MAKQPQPRRRAKPKLPDRLDEATLRRFVFQTFGRARRTQDSPVVPDVWLRYIRRAEEIARARIVGEPVPDDALDLLLTPWTGTTPGQIAGELRKRLKELERRKAARIAQSTSRVVATVDFLTLVRDVIPLTVWWQQLPPTQRELDTVLRWFQANVDATISGALSQAGSNVEFIRYAALVGFVNGLLRATTARDVENLEKLARQLGPPAVEEDAQRQEGRRRVGEPEPTCGIVRSLVEGYQNAIEESDAVRTAGPEAGAIHSDVGDGKGIYLINLNRPATQSLFESRNTVKADAAYRLFDISTAGIAFAVIDGGIDATHPAFLNRCDRDFEKRNRENPTFTKDDLKRWSRVAATYDFTILRDIIASEGDPQFVPNANRARIARLKGNSANDTAFEHLKVRSRSWLEMRVA